MIVVIGKLRILFIVCMGGGGIVKKKRLVIAVIFIVLKFSSWNKVWPFFILFEHLLIPLVCVKV